MGTPESSGLSAARLQAVLWDMDGTLVETEQYWGEGMFALARQLGGGMSEAARQRTVGTSLRAAPGGARPPPVELVETPVRGYSSGS